MPHVAAANLPIRIQFGNPMSHWQLGIPHGYTSANLAASYDWVPDAQDKKTGNAVFLHCP
jgi:hypothetical protein